MKRKCTAHSSRTGKPCQLSAIKGGTVCHKHGGSAPQVKKKAHERLMEAVDPAISRLVHLVDHAESEAVAAGAANSLLDRAGYGKAGVAKVTGEDGGITEVVWGIRPTAPS